MIWAIWAFLIIWTIVAVIMICLNASGIVAVVGSFFVTIVLLIILHFIIKPPPPPEKIAIEQQKIESIDAGTFAKIYVKQSLKAPITAKIQNVSDVAVAPLEKEYENGY